VRFRNAALEKKTMVIDGRGEGRDFDDSLIRCRV